MAKKVFCLKDTVEKFPKRLENLLNTEEAEYYNIIPVTSHTAGEFQCIVIIEEAEECDCGGIEEEIVSEETGLAGMISKPKDENENEGEGEGSEEDEE